MICYHNLGEIAHDVVTACPVRIGIKKRARCCDYWELGRQSNSFGGLTIYLWEWRIFSPVSGLILECRRNIVSKTSQRS
jgi:hypothetical protein